MDSNLDVTAYFHCVNWPIPDTVVTESVDPWYCKEIVATEGFEISGDDTEVIFEAGESIEMGADFNVKEAAEFRAIISP